MMLFALSSPDYGGATGKQVFPSSRHILVIEHSPAISYMLSSALELAGYRVTKHAGEAWLDSSWQSDEPPDLVLLDISRPEETALLQRLRTQWQPAPGIILLTTSKRIFTELATVERIMLKPFHIRDLLAKIQKVLSGENRSNCSI